MLLMEFTHIHIHAHYMFIHIHTDACAYSCSTQNALLLYMVLNILQGIWTLFDFTTTNQIGIISSS